MIENPTALNNVVTTRTTIFSRRRKRILIVDTTFALVGLGHSYLTVLFSPGNGNARTFITNRVRAFGPKHFRKVHASRVCVRRPVGVDRLLVTVRHGTHTAEEEGVTDRYQIGLPPRVATVRNVSRE